MFARRLLPIVGIASLSATLTVSNAVMLPGNEGTAGPINHLSTTVENREKQIYQLTESLNFPGILDFPVEAVGHQDQSVVLTAESIVDTLFFNLLRQMPKESWPNMWAIYFGPNPSEHVRPLSWADLHRDLPHLSLSSVSRLNFEGNKIILEELPNLPFGTFAGKIFRLRSAYKAGLYSQWIKANGVSNIREVYYSLDLLGEAGFAIFLSQASSLMQMLGQVLPDVTDDRTFNAIFGIHAAAYIQNLVSLPAEEFLTKSREQSPVNKLKNPTDLMFIISIKSNQSRIFSPQLACESALTKVH